MASYDWPTDQSLDRIATALEVQAGLVKFPAYSIAKGEYVTSEIVTWLGVNSSAECYGVEFPIGSATAGTKLGANAGMANPVPYTFLKEGSDPYAGKGAYRFYLVNGYFDDGGLPHVTAIQGDGQFAYDGSNGDVWVLSPVLYYREYVANAKWTLWVTDALRSGYSAQPGAITLAGGRVPFMMYARYGMSYDASGKPCSVSGAKLATRNVSHDSAISIAAKKGKGYALKTTVDDWYVKVMYLTKYATKDSQSVFAGCTGHTEQTPVTVAATGKAQVTIKKSVADSWPVGSAVCVGTTTTAGRDRGNADTYDLADRANIISKTVDGDNVTLTLDCPAFDSAVGQLVSTAPWNTGATDGLGGDGSPTNCKSGREPFQIQGIEMGYGAYELISNVLYKCDGTDGWHCFVNHDYSKEKAGTVAEGAEDIGKIIGGATEGWNYGMYALTKGGFMVMVVSGATSSSGMCDGHYKNADTVTGVRECLSLGNLWYGSNAGLFYVSSINGAGLAWWDFCSRLSGHGLRRCESAA